MKTSSPPAPAGAPPSLAHAAAQRASRSPPTTRRSPCAADPARSASRSRSRSSPTSARPSAASTSSQEWVDAHWDEMIETFAPALREDRELLRRHRTTLASSASISMREDFIDDLRALPERIRRIASSAGCSRRPTSSASTATARSWTRRAGMRRRTDARAERAHARGVDRRRRRSISTTTASSRVYAIDTETRIPVRAR